MDHRFKKIHDENWRPQPMVDHQKVKDSSLATRIAKEAAILDFIKGIKK